MGFLSFDWTYNQTNKQLEITIHIYIYDINKTLNIDKCFDMAFYVNHCVEMVKTLKMVKLMMQDSGNIFI